jgi:ATP-dependent RNA helicase DDX21
VRLHPDTVAALAKRGIMHLFPIQAQSFDALLAGRDMIAKARTGSGKTLAFALPIVELLRVSGAAAGAARGRTPRALVLAPTRELAKQVGDDFSSLDARLVTLCVYGGVGLFPQQATLRNGCDVVVGTPGRVMDLMEGGSLRLSTVKHVVLDEADRMLDKGFAEDVQKILSGVPGMGAAGGSSSSSSSSGSSSGSASGGGGGTAAIAASAAKTVQFILFSATVPDWVRAMARTHMVSPVTLDLVEGKATSLDVRHLVRYFRGGCAPYLTFLRLLSLPLSLSLSLSHSHT